jgi:Flp pilus assembly pilin Flp
MLNQIKKFMLDDSGLETVEWAIVGGIVVVAGALTFGLIGGDVKTALGLLQAETTKAATAPAAG